MAKVAIITRTKDRPILLKRAIQSVLNQNYDDWEHIIVNDGGNKETVETIVNIFAKDYLNRYKIIHNEASVGMEEASNIGIKASISDYLVIHDDDDSWDKEFLSKMLFALKNEQKINPSVKAIACQSIRVDEIIEGNEVKIIKEKLYNPNLIAASLLEMSGGNQFPPISFLFERQAAEKIGLFNSALEVLGDWDFHLRFLQHFEITILAKPLAKYHHRRDIKSEYGNSVTAQQNKHILYHATYTNQYLRNIPLNELIFQGKILKELKKQAKQQKQIYEKTKKNILILVTIQIILMIIFFIFI